jgi:hypothetical protein
MRSGSPTGAVMSEGSMCLGSLFSSYSCTIKD